MDATGSSVLTDFHWAPRRVRWHVRTRWRLFPFPSLLRFLPDQGPCVDLGCGHGLWAFMIAGALPEARVVGLDPDEEKITIARAIAAAKYPNVEFHVQPASINDVPDAMMFSLIDVAYLIPFDQQERLIEGLAARLLDGGVLLIKTMARRPVLKFAWNYFEESLAVKLFRITKGSRLYFRSEESWKALLAGSGLSVAVHRLDRGYLHPHLLYVARKA